MAERGKGRESGPSDVETTNIFWRSKARELRPRLANSKYALISSAGPRGGVGLFVRPDSYHSTCSADRHTVDSCFHLVLRVGRTPFRPHSPRNDWSKAHVLEKEFRDLCGQVEQTIATCIGDGEREAKMLQLPLLVIFFFLSGVDR